LAHEIIAFGRRPGWPCPDRTCWCYDCHRNRREGCPDAHQCVPYCPVPPERRRVLVSRCPFRDPPCSRWEQFGSRDQWDPQRR
jgi:hypothetical protein